MFSSAVISVGESFRESKAEYMKATRAMQDEAPALSVILRLYFSARKNRLKNFADKRKITAIRLLLGRKIQEQ